MLMSAVRPCPRLGKMSVVSVSTSLRVTLSTNLLFNLNSLLLTISVPEVVITSLLSLDSTEPENWFPFCVPRMNREKRLASRQSLARRRPTSNSERFHSGEDLHIEVVAGLGRRDAHAWVRIGLTDFLDRHFVLRCFAGVEAPANAPFFDRGLLLQGDLHEQHRVSVNFSEHTYGHRVGWSAAELNRTERIEFETSLEAQNTVNTTGRARWIDGCGLRVRHHR